MGHGVQESSFSCYVLMHEGRKVVGSVFFVRDAVADGPVEISYINVVLYMMFNISCDMFGVFNGMFHLICDMLGL